MNRQPDDFDALMEESLHIYANAEPRPGIELRILERTQGTTTSVTQTHFFRHQWGWLAALAAAGALAAILLHPHTASYPLTKTVASQNPTSPVLANPVPAAPVASLVVTPIRDRHHAPLRGPEPSERSSPLLEPTAQEKLLAQFVSTPRRETLSALNEAKAQTALNRPVTVNRLDVQPIKFSPIQFQPISSAPILIDPIQTASLQPSPLHPASF